MAATAPLSEKAPEETNNPAQELADREFNPDSYHQRQKTPAGDPSDPRGQLSEAEETASSPESAPQYKDQVGKGYKNVAAPRKFSLKGLMTKKNGIYGSGIIGLIIAVTIGIFASGPLEFIHLSQVLQKNFFHSENTAQIRNKGLLRYARTGQPEETRLGKLGSVVYNRTLSQLKDQGIEFSRNSRGVPDTMTIETAKNDSYKDLSGNIEQRAAIIEDYRITDLSTLKEISPGVFRINLTNTSLKGVDFVKATSKTAIGSLNNGKTETALAERYVKKAWDLPSLFSPLDKAKAVIKNKFASPSAEKQAADQAEQERTAQVEAAVTEAPAVAPEKTQVTDALKNSTGKVVVGALLGQTALCGIRSAADAAIALNRALIVLPATVQAADKIAIGSQIQSGKNIDLSQLGPIAGGFIDSNGKSIWQAKALQATENINNPSGPDLPADYGQAFSGDTSANSIRQAIQVKLPFTNVNITNVACSSIGIIVTATLSLGLIASGVFDGGASWAAVAANVGRQAAFAVGTAGVLYFLQQHLTDILQDKAIVPTVLSGPLGGNLLAYGARELGNVGARSMGGVALDNTQSSVLTQADQKEYDQQFQSQSVASRLFNINDSRSTISKLIDNTNLNPQGLAASVGHAFTNFGSMFTHSFSVLIPHALAAQPYNWGFPQYGVPDSIVTSPRFEDPYANADYVVANLLSPNDGAGAKDSHNMSYIDKAMACFGVDISRDSSGAWSVVATGDTNPDSDEYAKGNCNDTDDNWHRLMLFVTDSRLMDAIACQQGTDDQSCSNLDAGP